MGFLFGHFVFEVRLRTLLCIVLLLFAMNAHAESPNKSESTSVNNSQSIELSKRSDIQFRDSTEVGMSTFFKIMLVLGILAGVLYLVLFYLKKHGLVGINSAENTQKITQLGYQRLSAKTILHYVEVDGNKVLICYNDNAIGIHCLDSQASKHENLS